MTNLLAKYSHWLHEQWPAGTVEKLPVVAADGRTNLAGVYIVGDLTGTPLLKFASDSGAKAIHTLQAETSFSQRQSSDSVYDVVIIGGGVSGYAAALEAEKHGLNAVIVEANQAFSTLENFPKGKPIYTYPTGMTPEGELQFSDEVVNKESLLAALREQVANSGTTVFNGTASQITPNGKLLNVEINGGEPIQGHRVIVAIGRSGNYRKLGVEGEDLDKVSNRLIDPSVYAGKNLLVVGGGDSALEAAIACAESGAQVTLAHRRPAFSRAKPDNVEAIEKLTAAGKITLMMNSQVQSITEANVVLNTASGEPQSIDNDFVLLATGREAPLDFFRRSRMAIQGESSIISWVIFGLFILLMTAIYDWKGYGFLQSLWSLSSFPDNMPSLIGGLGDWWQLQVDDRSTLVGTIAMSMKSRSFYYTLLYTLLIGIFGWQRIQRRKTPYVKLQTTVLFFIQLFPLFLLPEVLLPYWGYNGVYDAGIGQSIANALFPSYITAADLAAQNWPDWGHPRAYWHAYGFILAWPLMVYNVLTSSPNMAWLSIAFVQSFVLIPLLVRKWGKGAYCSWICSCGAMAETMGDTQRHKMPHGPGWNKLNMLGQALLAIAFIMLFMRIIGWMTPGSWIDVNFSLFLTGENSEYKLVNPFSWKWTVDILLGGILGFGLYFKYSGRTWCRFACPLAALMHIYARFSRFGIAADKSKCISCNQCTATCHQGIDVMSFANKGETMVDPECVRCSACVNVCPTGTLQFAEMNKQGDIIATDKLVASPVHAVEIVDATK